jgi:hypothetical protein
MTSIHQINFFLLEFFNLNQGNLHTFDEIQLA